MKKLFLIIASLTLSLSLIACNSTPCTEHADTNPADGKCDTCGAELTPDEGGEGEGEGEGGGETASGDITLIEGGEAKFRFVLGSGVSANARSKINIFKSKMKSLYGINVSFVDDTADDSYECEVLVGVVSSRGEEYEYDMYSLGMEGYVIKAIGEKIIVSAGTEEGIIEAIELFISDYIGFDEDLDEFPDVKIGGDDWVEEIQDGYDITSITVLGEDIRGGKISYTDDEHGYIRLAAQTLQRELYELTGYYLPLSTKGDGVIAFSKSAPSDIESGLGFEIKPEGGVLYFNCAYLNKLGDALDEFLNTVLYRHEGALLFDGDFEYTPTDISRVYYNKDFGAVGNGITDDFEAIRSAHEFANLGGQTVYADPGATYYIGEHGSKSIIISTDTVWTGATFIIDDTVVLPGSAASRTDVFSVESHYKTQTYVANKDTLADMPISTLSAGQKNIGFSLGYPAALRLMSTYKQNHFRYGGEAGSNQQEIILIDKDGNVDETTPILWDYEILNYIEIYRMDIPELTVTGGHVISWVHTPELVISSNYTYFARGLNVRRPNTRIFGLKHTLEKEGANGSVPYGGFLGAKNTSNVIFENCVLQGHRMINPLSNETGTIRNGTYDTGAYLVNNLTWRNCSQINYAYHNETGEWLDSIYDESGRVIGTAYTATEDGFWGIMGTNVCKNLVYENSRLSRFDAHESTYNAKIVGCEVVMINLVGAGEFLLEDTTVTSASVQRGVDNFITLRDDYGSTWRGNITVRNVHMANNLPNINLIGIVWTPGYYGYTCYAPKNIHIENLSFENDCTLNLFSKNVMTKCHDYGDITSSEIKCSFADANSDGKCDGCLGTECLGRQANKNPYQKPEKITIIGADEGTTYILYDCEVFDSLEIELGEGVTVEKRYS